MMMIVRNGLVVRAFAIVWERRQFESESDWN